MNSSSRSLKTSGFCSGTAGPSSSRRTERPLGAVFAMYSAEGERIEIVAGVNGQTRNTQALQYISMIELQLVSYRFHRDVERSLKCGLVAALHFRRGWVVQTTPRRTAIVRSRDRPRRR